MMCTHYPDRNETIVELNQRHVAPSSARAQPTLLSGRSLSRRQHLPCKTVHNGCQVHVTVVKPDVGKVSNPDGIWGNRRQFAKYIRRVALWFPLVIWLTGRSRSTCWLEPVELHDATHSLPAYFEIVSYPFVTIARMLEHHRLNSASKMLVLTRLLVVVVHHTARHPQLFRQCALGPFGCHL